ncbi:MAG: ribosome recycling factor [Ruminococcaceae bacterium]|nr:ribosome recycling factor [Oscillospiraceae bacterium]
MDKVFTEAENKMKKANSVLEEEFGTIRVGRANAKVLDKITIEYYGTVTPLNQVASISSPDPRTLLIQPWDASTLKAIEKAILASDLGINPTNDGKSIRLAFPPLTEERRKELSKTVKKASEDGKVALRNIRRDMIDKLKAMKKKSEITEDDLANAEKKAQNLIDKYTKLVDELTAKKEKEIMEI